MASFTKATTTFTICALVQSAQAFMNAAPAGNEVPAGYTGKYVLEDCARREKLKDRLDQELQAQFVVSEAPKKPNISKTDFESFIRAETNKHKKKGLLQENFETESGWDLTAEQLEDRVPKSEQAVIPSYLPPVKQADGSMKPQTFLPEKINSTSGCSVRTFRVAPTNSKPDEPLRWMFVYIWYGRNVSKGENPKAYEYTYQVLVMHMKQDHWKQFFDKNKKNFVYKP